MGAPPPHRRDKYGHPLAEYPDSTEHGRLLGFDAVGNTAYADESTVTLAALTADGSLRVPVRDRRLTRRFPLDDAGLTSVEYLLYVADEVGPWRAFTELARERIVEADHDPESVLTDGPFAADAPALARQLDESDPAAVGDAGGVLRRLAMDKPDAVLTVLDDLFGFLSTTVDPDENRAAAYERRAVRADVAYVVVRTAWHDPEAVYASFDALIDVVGRDRDVDGDRPEMASLTDAVDRLGYERTGAVASSLVERIADEEPKRATTALNALYRLEHRYAKETHPLCSDGALRAAVDDAADREGTVGEAASAVETIHEFHPGAS